MPVSRQSLWSHFDPQLPFDFAESSHREDVRKRSDGARWLELGQPVVEWPRVGATKPPPTAP
jgi:hypothetical protein